jgi:hypothetical protein
LEGGSGIIVSFDLPDTKCSEELEAKVEKNIRKMLHNKTR